MDTTANLTTDDLSLIKVKEETKCVLEAFLKRSLSQDEGSQVGQVGRSYLDPKKYSHRPNKEDSRDGTTKKGKKAESKKSKESKNDREETLGDELTRETNGKSNSHHEENGRAEEVKPDFKINIKKLLRRDSHSKEKALTPKEKSGSVHSKSRDSIDGMLDDHGKGTAKRDSLKRPKSPNPLLACTVATSTISLDQGVEKHKEHEKRRPSKSFSLKKLLKKKTHKETSGSDIAPARPNTLPVQRCYEDEEPAHHKVGKIKDSEIYTLAAKQLETLIKHKKVKSPSVPQKFPPHLEAAENNNVAAPDRPPVEDKEEVIRKLVALLQEQAVVINEQINRDPFLRNALSRMSYGSFSRLAEVFTSQAEVAAGDESASVSPELTKIALTMELTRKVAGINSHTVHTLMGYSLQYMDMFVPWLQEQGGWENIVTQGDIADLQLD